MQQYFDLIEVDRVHTIFGGSLTAGSALNVRAFSAITNFRCSSACRSLIAQPHCCSLPDGVQGCPEQLARMLTL